MLDQQHLAAQRAHDLATLVAYREDLLQNRRAADDGGRRDLIAHATVEQRAEDHRRFFAGHGAADCDGQRIRARHRDRLCLGDDDHLVVGASKQDRVGMGQVRQQRQVASHLVQ